MQNEDYPELSRDDYSLLFHKAKVNLVAFRSVLDADEAIYRLVCMALKEDRAKRLDSL